MRKKVIAGVALVSAGVGASAQAADYDAAVSAKNAAALGFNYQKMATILDRQDLAGDQLIFVKYHVENNTVDLSALDRVAVSVPFHLVSDASENRLGGPPVNE